MEELNLSLDVNNSHCSKIVWLENRQHLFENPFTLKYHSV